MMKDHVSGHGTTTSVPGSPDHSWAARGKGKGISPKSGRAFHGEAQAQDSEMWSEEDFAWWTKGRKGKKSLPKGNDGFQKGGFRPHQPAEGTGKDCVQNKSKGKFRKGKGKEVAHPQSGLSASEAPEEEGKNHAWESDDWSSSQWPDDSWTPAAGGKAQKLILLGWQYPL